MIRILCSLALLFTAFVPAPAWAWGEFGHETIAAIAQDNVAPATRTKIRALFRAEKLLGTPECRLDSMEDASTWPDCVRRDRLRWGYTAPWHYQNVDICKPFDLKSPCANGNCVSAQIDRNAALLADKSLPANVRLEALAFLVHFVGDLHMPLHAGDRGDRGGNDVSASYGIISGSMNLHWLWDGPLAERAITDGPALVRRYSAAERAQLESGTTEDWSREAWAVSREFAYAAAQKGDPCGPPLKTRAQIDDAEIAALVPVARLQIERAGLRLAHLLDAALG